MKQALALLAVLLLAGCFVHVSEQSPSLVVSYSTSSQTQNGNTQTTVSATLHQVTGLDDWSQITVDGCQAPTSGPFELPHDFTGCQGTLTITHVATGDVLYSSA